MSKQEPTVNDFINTFFETVTGRINAPGRPRRDDDEVQDLRRKLRRANKNYGQQCDKIHTLKLEIEQLRRDRDFLTKELEKRDRTPIIPNPNPAPYKVPDYPYRITYGKDTFIPPGGGVINTNPDDSQPIGE